MKGVGGDNNLLPITPKTSLNLHPDIINMREPMSQSIAESMSL
jgi:hypothetical protein